MKLTLFFFACFFVSSLDCLKVTIYYESLCPDCREFITKQFYPAYQRISHYLEWYFIPYGHAKRHVVDGKWQFTCQHGPKECYINKGEACGINLARNVVDQVEYVNCVESSDRPGSKQSLVECCRSAYLQWDKVEECMNNGKGDQLLANYGKMTDELHPRFVPAIVFNDHFNATLQKAALTDFLGTACKLLGYAPKGCSRMFREEIEIILVN